MTYQDKLRLALDANVSLRTVDRRLTGERGNYAVDAAIELAAKRLGFTLPKLKHPHAVPK